MGDLFAPEIEEEDPEIGRLRDEEEGRAEADRLRATQDQLRTETRTRSSGRFGLRSLLGGFGKGGLISLLGR